MIDTFDRDHPWPGQCGVSHLFKFTRLDDAAPERLRQVLVEGRLYHALPRDFNDPWDCRPAVQSLSDGHALARARNHLVRVLREQMPRREAEREATATLSNVEQTHAQLQDALEETYGSVRVCSFAGRKDNHLLWAHYAAAHSGLCLEFDARKIPFSFARKVKYQSEYPTLEYPLKLDKCALVPLLTKSKDWAYEDEFRSLLNPNAPPPFPNYSEGIEIALDALTGVYLGAKMTAKHSEQIVDWVGEGPFQPTLWQVTAQRSSFALNFARL
ncbi:MAG: DUF2971 domain-containing protein [Betaproteobacteria bacterium]